MVAPGGHVGSGVPAVGDGVDLPSVAGGGDSGDQMTEQDLFGWGRRWSRLTGPSHGRVAAIAITRLLPGPRGEVSVTGNQQTAPLTEPAPAACREHPACGAWWLLWSVKAVLKRPEQPPRSITAMLLHIAAQESAAWGVSARGNRPRGESAARGVSFACVGHSGSQPSGESAARGVSRAGVTPRGPGTAGWWWGPCRAQPSALGRGVLSKGPASRSTARRAAACRSR